MNSTLKKANLVFSIFFIPLLNNNCSSDGDKEARNAKATSSMSDTRLIELMDEAKVQANELSLISDPVAQKISSGLMAALSRLENLIFNEKRPNNDVSVLAEIDFVVLA